MTAAKKPRTFASDCLESLKGTIARKIRHEINKNGWKYAIAEEIFGLSSPAISRIMNYKESSMSFETLHNAAVTAGMTVNMSLSVPDQDQERPSAL